MTIFLFHDFFKNGIIFANPCGDPGNTGMTHFTFENTDLEQ